MGTREKNEADYPASLLAGFWFVDCFCLPRVGACGQEALS